MVEPTHLKNMLVKLDHFPRQGWKSKIIETTNQMNYTAAQRNITLTRELSCFSAWLRYKACLCIHWWMGGNEFVIQKVETVDEGAFGATPCRCSKVIQCRMVVIWGYLWFSDPGHPPKWIIAWKFSLKSLDRGTCIIFDLLYRTSLRVEPKKLT